MKQKWTFLPALGLILGVLSLGCILISMFWKEGGNLFLILGLLLVCVNSILFQVLCRRKK